MKAELLLSRLGKVKATGPDRWLACCPAHEDKHPSLTVRELDDGRVLVHCFANCSVDDVLAAVGLGFDALYPDRPLAHAAPVRRPFPAADVLEAVAFETLVVQIAAADMAAGKVLSVDSMARLRVAADRLHQAKELALG